MENNILVYGIKKKKTKKKKIQSAKCLKHN